MSGIRSESHRPISLIWFFAATFGLSWVFWIPAAVLFTRNDSGASPFFSPELILLQTLGAAGPSIVAYWMLRRSGSSDAARPILDRYKIWRVGYAWYFIAALFVPVIQLAGHLIGGALSGGDLIDQSSPLGEMLADVGVVGAVALFPLIVIAQLPSSPLLEEFGWRGFALPRLQDRYSALTASLILGLLWGIWHLPLTLAYGDPVVPFLLQIIAISVIITWVFNNTRGSMLVAMLCHASLNASIVPFSSAAGHWPGTLLTIVAAILVVAFTGWQNLGKQPRFRWSNAGEPESTASRGRSLR